MQLSRRSFLKLAGMTAVLIPGWRLLGPDEPVAVELDDPASAFVEQMSAEVIEQIAPFSANEMLLEVSLVGAGFMALSQGAKARPACNGAIEIVGLDDGPIDWLDMPNCRVDAIEVVNTKTGVTIREPLVRPVYPCYGDTFRLQDVEVWLP